MKRINQFERTDRDIANALLNLMDRKPFEKITVQDIIAEAMINRSTFYQHYPDKYAILEQLQERLLAGMIQCRDRIAEDQMNDLSAINAVMAAYFAENRSELLKLFSVKSETLDLEGRMKTMVASYLSKGALSERESAVLAGMMVEVLIDGIRRGASFDTLSTEMLDLWLNLSVVFFRLEQIPEAKEKLLDCIRQLHAES